MLVLIDKFKHARSIIKEILSKRSSSASQEPISLDSARKINVIVEKRREEDQDWKDVLNLD